MKASPAIATGAPTGVKSNMPNGAPAVVSRKVAMMMLGGVPIMVAKPPRMVPNESGMSTTAGDCLALAAACITTGISRASAPTLFMTADRLAPRPDSAPMWSERRFAVSLTCWATKSTAPAFDSARDMTSTKATVTVAGCPKPRNAPENGTTPATTAASSARNATMS